MILVDTSVWVEHLRSGAIGLGELLIEGHVACHPFIIGELACGNLKNRTEILSLLHDLPTATRADDDEVFQFIEDHKLMGKGLGYIDIHLLMSAMLTGILSSSQTTRHCAIMPVWKILMAENSIIVPEKQSGFAPFKEYLMAKVQKLLPRPSAIIDQPFING